MYKKNFNYRDFHLKYDMSSEINIGTGIVKVNDIFDEMPVFMKQADCLFIDPPCSNGNYKSFYTKAEKSIRENINLFNQRLFDLIAEINPEQVFLETFKSNKETISRMLLINGYIVKEFPSYYYGNKNNKCWILHGCKTENNNFDIPYVDEEKVIEHICKTLDFECIGDLCMGKGLVGFYANKYNKRFVGTELNEKRLACLIEHINVNRIIVR